MKRIYKIASGIFIAVALILVGGGIYLKYFLPNIKIKDLKVEVTKERVERGRYLANCVLVCVDCHSVRDWSRYSGPIIPGSIGMGGEVFDQTMGLPGKYIAPNITPYTMSKWSDGEIYRAITSGVGKRGNALFPIMPYMAYGTLDNEDIFSVIAYLRSLTPIQSDIPASKSDFPVNFIVNTLPKEGHPTKRPSPKDSLEYGKYLTIAASCLDCHTPFVKGSLVMEKAFSGGREFPTKDGRIAVSANITFDPNSGIGKWDKETFIGTFKYFDIPNNETAQVGPDKINSPMPWTMYSKMDTLDLVAIYTYLKSLRPIAVKR